MERKRQIQTGIAGAHCAAEDDPRTAQRLDVLWCEHHRVVPMLAERVGGGFVVSLVATCSYVAVRVLRGCPEVASGASGVTRLPRILRPSGVSAKQWQSFGSAPSRRELSGGLCSQCRWRAVGYPCLLACVSFVVARSLSAGLTRDEGIARGEVGLRARPERTDMPCDARTGAARTRGASATITWTRVARCRRVRRVVSAPGSWRRSSVAGRLSASARRGCLRMLGIIEAAGRRGGPPLHEARVRAVDEHAT